VYSDHATKPSPVSALCWQIHRPLAVLVPLLRVWVHCPRASNGLLPRRSNLVGYVQWDARFDQFLLVRQSLQRLYRSQPTIKASVRPGEDLSHASRQSGEYTLQMARNLLLTVLQKNPEAALSKSEVLR
jgi:hypothetical protein